MGVTTQPDIEQAPGRPRFPTSEIQNQLEAWLKELAGKVDDTTGNAGFWHLLEGMSRLWRTYSVMNACLIWMQLPDATSVAGRRRWEKLGRVIRDGVKPAVIRAPAGSSGRFVAVEVYDIAQTDGPPLPDRSELVLPRAISDRCPAVLAAAGLLDIEVGELDLETPAIIAGRALDRHHVLVRHGLDGAALISVLVHEYAHALLHFPEATDKKARQFLPERFREAEAEAVAYLALTELGLTSTAPGYIARHGVVGKELLRMVKRVCVAARAIIRAIDGERVEVRMPAAVVPFKRLAMARCVYGNPRPYR